MTWVAISCSVLQHGHFGDVQGQGFRAEPFSRRDVIQRRSGAHRGSPNEGRGISGWRTHALRPAGRCEAHAGFQGGVGTTDGARTVFARHKLAAAAATAAAGTVYGERQRCRRVGAAAAATAAAAGTIDGRLG